MPPSRPRPVSRARSRTVPLAAAGMVALAGAGCTGTLDPRGPSAGRQYGLFMVSVVVAGIVVVVVLALMAVSLRRHRPGLRGDRFVVVGGLLIPSLVLAGIMLATFVVLAEEPDDGDMVIEVVGHQYWWEVVYPDGPGGEPVVSANEVHLPADTPVQLRLTADDVIHSLWVPELGGKIDMVPGRTNTLVLEGDTPGTYWGRCAEYCGLQHTHMLFQAVVHPPGEFESWLANEAEGVATDDVEALQAFDRNACAACHTLRGTEADGQVGPDLTHVGSRERIGAGVLEHTPGNLGSWIRDPQEHKPGAEMPPIPTLTDDELDDLVDYLQSLQ